MLTAPRQLQFQVPKLYLGLVGDGAGAPLVIEHAAIKSRIPETLLARLLSHPPFGKVVIFSPWPKRYAFLIESWCNQAGFKLQRRVGGYVYQDAVIWCLKCGGEPDELPDTPDTVYVFDAHAIDRCPYPDLSRIGIVCGELAPRGHWFYQLARNTEASMQVGGTGESLPIYQRFPADEICKQWESSRDEVESHRRSMDHFSFDRKLNLVDKPEVINRVPFSRFARDRLFIRSDKKGVHLNEHQSRQRDAQEGTPVVSFYLSRMQKRYLAAKRKALSQGKKPRFLLLKYRRGGFTTLEQGINYATAIQRPNSYVVTLAHKGPSTERIFSIAKLYRQMDPKAGKIEENAHRLAFPNGSQFFIGTAGSDGFGRGETIQRVHGSEVSKWCLGPRQFERVADLVSGLVGAASNGEVILETTPNGVEWFAAMYKEAKNNGNDYTPIFLPWFADPGNRLPASEFNETEIRDTLAEDEKDLVDKYDLSFAQLAFRRSMKREHKSLFPQEYPEDDISCFLTSGTPYFDVQRVLFLASKVKETWKTETVSGGLWMQWEPPIPGEDYVLGADTSEGIKGGDPCGFGIMHKKSGRQVFSLHGYFTPTVLAGHIVKYAKLYNNALAGVERNNHGHAVLSSITVLGYTHPNRLYHFAEDRMGWSTDSASRPVMLNDLYDAIQERGTQGGMWNDPVFLDECTTFKLQTSGNFEADPGAHDDSVIKWAICEQMRSVVKREPKIYVV